MRNSGHVCPRCIKGYLITEFCDRVCLNCGYRPDNGYHSGDIQEYTTSAIVARLQHNGNGDLDDIGLKHMELAGLAK